MEKRRPELHQPSVRTETCTRMPSDAVESPLWPLFVVSPRKQNPFY